MPEADDAGEEGGEGGGGGEGGDGGGGEGTVVRVAVSVLPRTASVGFSRNSMTVLFGLSGRGLTV